MRKKNRISKTEFLGEPGRFLAGLEGAGGPVYITSGGRPTAVLVGAKDYDSDRKRLEGYERMVKGLEEAEKDRMKAHAAVMAELSRRAKKV